MNILLTIINNGGYVSDQDLTKLATEFPDLPLVLKLSASPREQIAAKYACARIQVIDSMGEDYVREVFISANNCDHLRKGLGLPQDCCAMV